VIRCEYGWNDPSDGTATDLGFCRALGLAMAFSNKIESTTPTRPRTRLRFELARPGAPSWRRHYSSLEERGRGQCRARELTVDRTPIENEDAIASGGQFLGIGGKIDDGGAICSGLSNQAIDLLAGANVDVSRWHRDGSEQLESELGHEISSSGLAEASRFIGETFQQS
jgi:hypothetical protein